MKKSTWTRLLSMLMALCLVVSLCTVSAFADEEQPVADTETVEDSTPETNDVAGTSENGEEEEDPEVVEDPEAGIDALADEEPVYVAMIGETGYEDLATAIAAAVAGDTIVLQANAEIEANIEITKSITLNLNGFNVTQKNTDYVFKISKSAIFTLTGSGTLTGPTNTENCGVIYISGTSTVFNMEGGTITGSTEKNGGGVYVASGTFNMNGGTISDCTATGNGAGVYVYKGTFNMNGGTISGCTATGNGGAVYVASSGVANVSGGSIIGCSAANGGGVTVYGGIFNFTNGAISDCSATSNGGACYVAGSTSSNIFGTANMSGGTVSGCSVGEGGKGYTFYANIGSVNISGGVILQSTSLSRNTSNGTIVISGGWFKSKVSDSYKAEGYVPIGPCVDAPNANATYTVVAEDAAHTVHYVVANCPEVTLAESTSTGATAVTLEARSQAGYESDGNWYLDAECGGEAYTAESELFFAGEELTVYANWTKSTYVISAKARISGTDTSVAGVHITGGGQFTCTDSPTLSANAVDGFSFAGWYENGTCVCSSADYAIQNPTADMDLTAYYTAEAGAARTLTVDADQFTISGETDTQTGEQSYNYYIGTSVTVTSLKDASDGFLYWTNDSGKIVSTSPAYTFILASNTSLHAVCIADEEQTTTVIFLSAYGQVINKQKLSAGSIAEVPDGPAKMGCTFDYWAYEGTTEKVADIQSDISQKIGTETVLTLCPVYKEATELYNITVNYSGAEGEDISKNNVTVGDSWTVIAEAVIGEKVFQCWQDANGNVLSYEPAITIRSSVDITITAVYVEETEKSEAQAVINVTGAYATAPAEGKYRVSFTEYYKLPDDMTLVATGFVYSVNDTGVDLVLDGDGTHTAKSRLTCSEGSYTVNFNTSEVSKVFSVRAYAQYLDEYGTLQTIYSGVFSTSYQDMPANANEWFKQA